MNGQIRTDEELLNILKDYYIKNGFPKRTYFKVKNNLPDHAVYVKRFGSWANALTLSGIEIPSNKSRILMNNRNTSDKELLSIMKKQYEETGIFPTQSLYTNKNGLPSYSVYVNRFGSFQTAIKESGMSIPEKELYKFTQFNNCDDKELLEYLKSETEKHLQNNLFLLTQETIDLNRNMPSASVYQRRFGGIVKAYEKLGIDYENYNNDALEMDLIKKIKQISSIINRTPNSRDLDRFSKNNKDYYSSKTYIDHFRSIYQSQVMANLSPTKIGMNKTNEEMLSDLIRFKDELGRVPTLKEIDSCEYLCSSGYYLFKFKTYYNALKLAGIPENEFNKNNIYFTKKGTKCLSLYELDITEWLEGNGVNFDKEVKYRDVIKGDRTMRRFDWVVNIGDITYYIEMFGREHDISYDLKAKGKIKTCEENNLNLIPIYPLDLKEKPLEEIFSFLYTKK